MMSFGKLEITTKQLKGKSFIEQKKLFQDAIKGLRLQNIHRFQPEEYRKALIDYLRFLHMSCANREPDTQAIADGSTEFIQDWITQIVLATEENERVSDEAMGIIDSAHLRRVK
ncbi:MAG: hypothetical protein PHH70_00310 [Candidatus Gracilibacteria bacterium]|nr:hypothetical protein [Candidatus Gracilibacteria bacterium]